MSSRVARSRARGPVARSFPPLARPSARVLILGSMPGAESLRRRQYYAFRHNQFWPIVNELLGVDSAAPYEERVSRLTARDIAVWDVLKRCERDGSLDGSILPASEVANDFKRFFREHPRIHAVFFNGAKSEHAFRRHVLPRLGARAAQLRFHRLPSTSPAHAGMPRAAKLRAWRRVRDAL
jgi:hypoxanthine-DNA glycosylase